MNRSKVLYYSFLLQLIIIPLAISKYFYNINDLLKSSALTFTGGIFICSIAFMVLNNTIKNKNLNFTYKPLLDTAIVIFFLACILATIFSLKPAVSFWGQYERQFGLVTYIYITLIYFLSGFVLDDPKNRKSAIQVMEIVSVIVAFYAILQFIRFDIFNLMPDVFKRPISTLGNPVFLGGFLILTLPFSVLNVSEKKNNFLKYLFPLIIVTGIIISGTRSAYIALAVQGAITFYFYKKKSLQLTKKKIIGTAGILIILTAGILIFYDNGVLAKRVIDVFNFNNPRLVLWRDALNMVIKYPVFGPGIGMFAPAFDEFYSSQLRFMDAFNVYDNAHNNYLQILFTMGIAGLLAYLFLIVAAFKTAFGIINTPGKNVWNKKLSHSFIIMLCGYCLYGFTNFDEISISFYLFIYLSIIRSVDIKKQTIKLTGVTKLGTAVISSAVVILCIINIFTSYKKLEADRYFNIANSLFLTGDFTSGIKYNNMAIYANPDCAFYRFYLAVGVHNYCFDNSLLNNETKLNLLKQAEMEIDKVKQDLYYLNYSNGVLSLIYYEEGRVEEADSLKDEVLKVDSINTTFRMKIMRYFLKMNRLEEANRSLKIILLIKPNETASWLLAAMYYNQAQDKDNAIYYSKKVLQKDPANKTASNIINSYSKK